MKRLPCGNSLEAMRKLTITKKYAAGTERLTIADGGKKARIKITYVKTFEWCNIVLTRSEAKRLHQWLGEWIESEE